MLLSLAERGSVSLGYHMAKFELDHQLCKTSDCEVHHSKVKSICRSQTCTYLAGETQFLAHISVGR
jgi:hypothetical protein